MKQFNAYGVMAGLVRGAAVAFLLIALAACGDDGSDFAARPDGTVPASSASKTNASFGTMTDERDGQTYRTVKIGDQTWMAENLNFETENSLCIYDSVELCAQFGRLYRWSDAMDSAGTWSENGKGCGKGKKCVYQVGWQEPRFRGVCPEGWHLPNDNEWSSLIYAVTTAVGHYDYSDAAGYLKSSTGWAKDGNGTDDYGFSALPAGCIDSWGYGGQLGLEAHFWTSTEDDEEKADKMHFTHSNDVWYMYSTDKKSGRSVRCVMD